MRPDGERSSWSEPTASGSSRSFAPPRRERSVSLRISPNGFRRAQPGGNANFPGRRGAGGAARRRKDGARPKRLLRFGPRIRASRDRTHERIYPAGIKSFDQTKLSFSRVQTLRLAAHKACRRMTSILGTLPGALRRHWKARLRARPRSRPARRLRPHASPGVLVRLARPRKPFRRFRNRLAGSCGTLRSSYSTARYLSRATPARFCPSMRISRVVACRPGECRSPSL